MHMCTVQVRARRITKQLEQGFLVVTFDLPVLACGRGAKNSTIGLRARVLFSAARPLARINKDESDGTPLTVL